MEAIEQAHNGCIGHPVTNLLMSASAADMAHTFAAAVAGPVAFVNDGQQPGDAGHGYVAEPDALGDEIPAEVLASIEAAFDDMTAKIETAVRQVRDTDERTAHLVITCERLARGQVEILEKIDRILNHFKVA